MSKVFLAVQEQFDIIKTRMYPLEPVSKTLLETSNQIDTPTPKRGAKRGRKPKDVLNQEPPLPETPTRSISETENDESTSADEPVDSEPGTGYLNFRKRKSILQPTGSKFSKKAAGRRRSLPLTNHHDDGLDAEGNSAEVQDNSPLPPANHHGTIQLGSHTTTNQELRSPSPATHHTYAPRKYQEIKLVSYKIPSSRPQGPGDLWTCEFRGCGKRVHEGSTPAGITKIDAHFQTHQRQAQEKIELAYQESRPYLPVEQVVSVKSNCTYQANCIKEPGSPYPSSSPPIQSCHRRRLTERAPPTKLNY